MFASKAAICHIPQRFDLASGGVFVRNGFHGGAYSTEGLNRGEGLFDSTRMKVYDMAVKNERISNILLEKEKEF